jgi:hypothetical protein
LLPSAECVLSAGAALAGALVLSEPAEAKIVYTATNVVMQCTNHHSCHTHRSFDLNHDGIPDVGFTIQCYQGLVCGFGASPARGDGIEEGANHSRWAAALKAGKNIEHAKKFNPAASMTMAFVEKDGSGGGYWFYAQARYLGVVFQIKGKPHYGWMRIKNSSDTSATFTGYAYETIPGKAIKVGQTHGKDDVEASAGTMNPDDPGPGASITAPIPDKRPASLGMLAMGAQGVPLWRRKQEMETVKYGRVVSAN